MDWILYALITAFSVGTADLFNKRALKEADPYTVAWAGAAFSFMFLLPLVVLTHVPEMGWIFWQVMIFQVMFLTFTQVLYMKAIQTSPLSLTLPMLAFTPAFMLFTSPLILGESPDRQGLIGILFIVFGAYALNIQRPGEGFLSPLKALFYEKGPVMMLLVAFIWSVTANVDKIGVLNSSPYFYILVLQGFLTVALFFPMHFKSPQYREQTLKNLHNLIPAGFLYAVAFLSQMTALTLTIAPFVISLKRTSIIVTSIYGFIFFKETHIKQRLSGAVLMVVGAFFISLL